MSYTYEQDMCIIHKYRKRFKGKLQILKDAEEQIAQHTVASVGKNVGGEKKFSQGGE